VVRQFLEVKSPEEAVRELMATDLGYDDAVWKQMARQLGLQGALIPEELGGSGLGVSELNVVLEEMGRALLCAPFFSTVVLATNTILLSGDQEAMSSYLPLIASGDSIATLALSEEAGRWDEASISATGTLSNGAWTVSGTKSFVLDGHVANLILVAARTGRGISLFGVEAVDEGLSRSLLPTLDQTRKLAKVRLDRVPARLIGNEGTGWSVLEKVLDMAAVSLAAEEVGGAQKVLEAAVDYAKTRIQFSRPIGSFQAIKHKCADMLLDVETARSASYYATSCAAEGSEELPSIASLAKAYCSAAYIRAAAANIQIHGGIGFTWEHPAHLYLKRAKSSELLFGTPAYHRDLLANRLGI